MKKKILITLLFILAGIGALCSVFYPDSNINTQIDEIQKVITDEIQTLDVVVSDETQEIVDETIEAIEAGEDLSTTEIIESSEEEEQEIFDEGALETDAVLEQENIEYNGTNTGNGISLLGSYQGLTYYSQADSRWANMLYTSTGNATQTMKSSACGPTSAAMIVSSSKGAILPTTMANLAVDNGYRTANDGTAWAFFPFVADYFNFNEYYTTSNFNTAMNYLSQKQSDGSSKYYIIVSCGSGLFTTGGHYIVLTANNSGTITVYDPYLYSGKFNTASRRAAGVVVSGNSAYVSESAFKQYANYKNFWIFSNDSTNGLKNETTNAVLSSASYVRYVATQSVNLNVRNAPGGNVINSLKKGTSVTVTEVKGDWSKISSPVSGWVSTSYLSSVAVNNASTTIGNTYKLKSPTTLYSKSNLTGITYNYKANTSVKVINHINVNVDYVYIPATGRYAYCYISAYSSNSISNNVSTTIGKYYRLKNNTILYSNSNLTGTKYNYLSQTQIKIISHVSSNIDYVYVVKTGRYAYCNKNAY